MKKTVLATILTVLILLTTVSGLMAENSPESLFTRQAYNPAVVYNGSFRTNAIYFHNRRNPVWYPGLKEELDSINCKAAQDSFRKSGRWNGHFVQGSSCGETSEPTEWAVGNWLNFSAVKGK